MNKIVGRAEYFEDEDILILYTWYVISEKNN